MSAPELEEGQRQLIVRALALQGLRNPGFSAASRTAAVAIYGGAELTSRGGLMFDEIQRLLKDVVEVIGC